MNDNIGTTRREKLTYPVSFAVLLVWIAAAVYSFISQVYTPLEVTTPVMLLLAGYVFGIQITRGPK